METTGNVQYATRLVEQIATDGTVTWYADHPALPGCHAVGSNQDEALLRLAQARDAWIAVSQQLGDEVPSPIDEERILIQYALRKNMARADDVAGVFRGIQPIEVAPNR